MKTEELTNLNGKTESIKDETNISDKRDSCCKLIEPNSNLNTPVKRESIKNEENTTVTNNTSSAIPLKRDSVKAEEVTNLNAKRESIKKEDINITDKRESFSKKTELNSYSNTPVKRDSVSITENVNVNAHEKRESISNQVTSPEKYVENKIKSFDVDVAQRVEQEENEIKLVKSQIKIDRNDRHDKINTLPSLATEQSLTTPLIDHRKKIIKIGNSQKKFEILVNFYFQIFFNKIKHFSKKYLPLHLF